MLCSGDEGAMTGVYVCLISGVPFSRRFAVGNRESAGSAVPANGIGRRGDESPFPAKGDVAARRGLMDPTPILEEETTELMGEIRPIMEVDGIPSPNPSLAGAVGLDRNVPAPSTKNVIGTGPLDPSRLISVLPTRVGIGPPFAWPSETDRAT